MSTLYVDNLQPNLGSGVSIPGHVIQAQVFSWTTEFTVNATSFADVTDASFTFTPKSNNSMLIITTDMSVRINGGGATSDGFTFRNVVDGTALHTPGENHEYYMSSTQDLYSRISKTDTYTNTSTTSKTIKIQAAGHTSSSNNRINFSNRFKSTVTVMEIAQ